MSGAVEEIRVERRGPVLEVTLDRPKANAIDAPTSRSMGEVFAGFRDDPELRVAIVTGGGDRFFSAGWDLKAMAEAGEADLRLGVGGFAGLQELPDLNKPVIAAVNGMAAGGGFELAISADLIVCSETARFALPEIKNGILPDAASIKLPRRIAYHLALDLLMTGRWMDAEEAKRWGLVRDVVPQADLMASARELADQLASGPPLVFAAIKETIRETMHLPVQEAFDIVNGQRLPTVEKVMNSNDMIEGARAFSEKRAPVWTGT
jgi:crotonobetainyl-CoA hydratase